MHRTLVERGSTEQLTTRLSWPSHDLTASDTSACLRLDNPQCRTRLREDVGDVDELLTVGSGGDGS